MKKFLLLLSCVATLGMFATACSNDGDGDEIIGSGDIKSVENGMMFGNVVHFKYVYTPSFDSKGRLSKLSSEHFEQVREESGAPAASGKTFLAEKGTIEYKYDESARTARVTESSIWYTQDGKKEGDDSVNYTYFFNSDWNLIRGVYNPGTDDEYNSEYGYTDGRLSNYSGKSLEWRGGNLVRSWYEGYDGEELFEFGNEANPFKDGIDVTFGFLLPQEYIFGLMGKHCENLPVKHIYQYSDGSSVSKFEYIKDKSGRITQIREIYVDPETEKPYEEEDGGHYHYWKIHYK